MFRTEVWVRALSKFISEAIKIPGFKKEDIMTPRKGKKIVTHFIF